MNNLESHIKIINEKLQQLLKKHQALKKENENLKQTVAVLKKKEEEYATSLTELEQKVNILKVSSGQISDADQKEFEKRINQYIKEIDKCIGMLSE